MSDYEYGLTILSGDDDKEVSFGVTDIPNRRSPCLFIKRGTVLEPLAYFRSTEHAKRFFDEVIVGLAKCHDAKKPT